MSIRNIFIITIFEKKKGKNSKLMCKCSAFRGNHTCFSESTIPLFLSNVV